MLGDAPIAYSLRRTQRILKEIMQDLTTLVCLSHHDDQAKAAEEELRNAGIPAGSVTVIGGSRGAIDDLDKSELASLGMPDRDYDHLKAGLRDGGVVISVSTIEEYVRKIESIFEKHRAEKIDEAETTRPGEPLSTVVPDDSAATVPLVQEELVVGKRTVDQGGVRLYRKIVEIPVEQSLSLRDEHVRVNRLTVDRPVTERDLAFQPRSVELLETTEEVVIAKEARVVEEIVVTKGTVERTETINATVRHTEVELQELPSGSRKI
jgi:uncharacterized protein (TIGR02271 family)